MTDTEYIEFLRTEAEERNALLNNADTMSNYMTECLQGELLAIQDISDQIQNNPATAAEYMKNTLKSMNFQLDHGAETRLHAYLLYFIHAEKVRTGQSYSDLLAKYA